MAQKNQEASKAPAQASRPKKKAVNIEEFQLPEGFTQVNLDLVGFYYEDTVLHCIPRNVKLFDNKIESQKVSALVTAEVCHENAHVINSDGEPVVAEIGQLIGIWGRPGLKELNVFANSHVMIVPAGEEDIGKPSPMKMFKIFSNGKDAAALPVTLDKRDKSKHAEHPWGPLQVSSGVPAA